MFNMVENIKFKHANNAFQNKLNYDIKTIKSSPKVLTFANKSRNIYQLDKDRYNKLKESITNRYKLADDQSVDIINRELKPITDSLDISDRIKTMTNTKSFITLKDQNRPKCNFIHPAKTNLSPVSKQILENINNKVRSYTKQTNVETQPQFANSSASSSSAS